MKLIDADALLEVLNKKSVPFNANVNDAILTAPTVDAVSREKYEASKEARHILVEFADDLLAKLKERVEVVRCKDCKHWKITSDGFGECNVMEKQFLGKEYCSFGERKEE